MPTSGPELNAGHGLRCPLVLAFVAPGLGLRCPLVLAFVAPWSWPPLPPGLGLGALQKFPIDLKIFQLKCPLQK